jgi:hypothetical protein
LILFVKIDEGPNLLLTTVAMSLHRDPLILWIIRLYGEVCRDFGLLAVTGENGSQL